jgi:hypothetical protein
MIMIPLATEGFPLLLDEDQAAPRHRFFRTQTIAMIAIAALSWTMPELFGGIIPLVLPRRTSSTTPKPAIYRVRRSVWSIMEELGEYGTRRAYRMKRESFFQLFRLLEPHMVTGSRKRPSSGKKRRSKKYDGATNGIIPKTSRLSIALRWFAGGSVWDIAIVHGVSVSAVYESIWIIVHAVNVCSSLRLQFPHTHQKQREAAQEFKKISKAGFGVCVGAIDGVLIWTERPTDADCKLAKCGPKKFFCGRKKKFGFNMQAVVDSKGRFLDVSIRHPGTTSDYLAFTINNQLYNKLETQGFLAPGLCLFGDSAYVNTRYMATPYKNATGRQDDYNFYHSSVRIKVECSFGMFFHRWGVLRKPLQNLIGMSRQVSLVLCLCKLHNFCITEGDGEVGSTGVENLARDTADILCEGGIPLETTRNNPYSPEQLLHGGEHQNGITRNDRRRLSEQEDRVRDEAGSLLPREILYNIVISKGLTRRTPARWNN